MSSNKRVVELVVLLAIASGLSVFFQESNSKRESHQSQELSPPSVDGIWVGMSREDLMMDSRNPQWAHSSNQPKSSTDGTYTLIEKGKNAAIVFVHSGSVVGVWGGRTLSSHNEALKVGDSRAKILRALGTPEKVESIALNPNEHYLFPADTRWRYPRLQLAVKLEKGQVAWFDLGNSFEATWPPSPLKSLY